MDSNFLWLALIAFGFGIYMITERLDRIGRVLDHLLDEVRKKDRLDYED